MEPAPPHNIINNCLYMVNAGHPNVVSVFLNQGRKLHTTHSWDFMLMEKDGVVDPSSLWKRARFGEDSIIANLDTGGIEFFSLFFSLLCLTFSPLNPPSKMSNTFIPESKRPSSFRVCDHVIHIEHAPLIASKHTHKLYIYILS